VSARRRVGAVAALGSVLLTLAIAPGAARAAYTAPALQSSLTTQQFNLASGPSISADGQWLAFAGSLGGVSGIYRRNVVTGEVDTVYAGIAAGPSISADGRYVAFTTTADLDPSEEPSADAGCAEVYVRDMDAPAGSAGSDILVSARDGSTQGLTFTGCSTATPTNGVLPATGAQAAAGVAISQDGSEVAFTVLSPSDLGLPAGSAPTTPASQVAVRNLQTDATTLVSVTPSGQPTPGGGAYPSTTSRSIGVNDPTDLGGSEVVPASTAAISGDGTTVAWMGTEVPSQVPSATDVVPGMSTQVNVDQADPAGQEVEPLWRRIADGASATTVRLLTGAGLSFYGYTGYESNQALPIEGGSAEGSTPGSLALSADGQTVVLDADAPPAADVATLIQSQRSATLPYDVYAVQVADGVAPQVTPITQVGNYAATAAGTATASSVAISPSGEELGFETARTDFPLASPALITPPTSYDSVAETYVADLPLDTLELATSTFDGSAANGDSGSIAIDQAGDVAVASLASNLFYGDPDPSSPEVYLLDRVPQATAVAIGSIGAPFTSTPPAPSWTLGATATRQSGGKVVLHVSVPGAGRVSATATAQLPTRAAKASHAVRKTQPKTGTPEPSRTVAAGHRTARAAADLSVALRLRPRYRTLAQARGGLYATATVTFTAAGHPPLTQTVPVTFHLARATTKKKTTTGPGQKTAR
jgi:hypothetical protein